MLLQILQESPTATNHPQEAVAGVQIFLVRLKMAGKGADSVGQQRDLHLRRPGVGLVETELFDHLLSFCSSWAH